METAEIKTGVVSPDSPYRALVSPKTTPFTLSRAQYGAGVVLLVLASVLLRFWNLDGTDMWTDEVLTAFRARAPLDDTVDSILCAGNQAPLFYIMMRVLPHDSQLMLRIPALVLGLLSIVLATHLVTHLYQDQMLGLQVGALMAVSPLHVILSRTARFYTLLLVLALIATLLFIVILRGRRTRTNWAVFALASAMAYLTHYSAVALPASQGALLVLSHEHRPLFRKWMLVQILAAVPAGLWSLAGSQSVEKDGFLYNPQLAKAYDLPLTFMNLTTGYVGEFEWYLVPGVILAMIGLIAGLVFALRAWRQDPERTFWLMLGVIPILALFALGVSVMAKYKDRYFLIAMPALFLTLVWGWRGLSQQVARLRGLGSAALAVVLLTGTIQTIHTYRSGEYQRTDWSDAANYVETHIAPGDNLMFARWSTFEAFKTYFDGDKAVLDARLLMTETADTGAFEASSTRIWVIYRTQYEHFHRQGWQRDFEPLQEGVAPMSDWLLEREDRILSRADFDGVIIFLVNGLETAPTTE